MSLKGSRYELATEIMYFCNTVATRGGMMSLLTSGSGAATDQSAAVVSYAANASGNRPVGILMGDVVNYDLTRQHINFQRDEVQVGGKVRLLRKGFVVTNNITNTPNGGDGAYLDSSGNLLAFNTVSTTATNYKAGLGLAQYPYCGYFASTKDEDGFAKVEIDV